MIKLIQRHFVAFFATFALALPAAATTYSTDYTDLWWSGASESGWGINFVQQYDIIFATAFVYHSDNTAHWYSATLRSVGGSTSNYSGALQESRGPWLGSPTFDPNAVTRVDVGTMTVSFSGPNNGSLNYTVTGAPAVSKQITRLSFATNNISGAYIGGMVGRSSGCGSVTAGQVAVFDNLTVTQSGTSVSMRVDFNQGGTGTPSTCTYNGTLVQNGRLSAINGGTYSCTVGGAATNAGTFSLSGIDAGVNGFSSTFTGQDQYCSSYTGRFGGVRDVP